MLVGQLNKNVATNNPKSLLQLASHAKNEDGYTIAARQVVNHISLPAQQDKELSHFWHRSLRNLINMGRINEMLCYAAQSNRWSAVRYLIEEEGADVNNKTLLYYAAKNGNLDVMEWLVNKGANIHASDLLNQNPLHVAVKGGHFDVVTWLINRGVALSTINSDGDTPLHLAANSGHSNIAKLLIDNGADIHAFNSNGETSLHGAVKSGHFDIVTWLINRGADIHAVNIYGETPLDLARTTEIREFLESAARKVARREEVPSRMDDVTLELSCAPFCYIL